MDQAAAKLVWLDTGCNDAEGVRAGLTRCEERGARVFAAPARDGHARHCIMRDPSGTPSAICEA